MSTELPLVSVVVTAYNMAPYVERTLESALAQDYAGPIEVIVVDDGSTDATPQALADYADRVRVVSQENRGFIRAVNRGLDAASGELIAFLDGDDTWPTDRIRRQAAFLAARPEVGLVHGDMEIVDEHDAVVEASFFASHNVRPERGDVFGRLIRGNFVSGGASLFRASLKGLLHPIADGSLGAAWPDWWIAVRIAEVAEIDYIPGIANRYRLHGSNMCLGVTGQRLATSRRSEIRFRRWMLANLHRSRASLADLAFTFHMLGLQFGEIASIEGGRPTAVAPVAPADAAAAVEAFRAGVEATEQGQLETGARLFLRALGLDPLYGAARSELQFSLSLLEQGGGLERTGSPLPRASAVRRSLQTRSFVVVVAADELVERPALLAEFGRAFGPDDDATLVVRALGWDEATLVETLGAVLAAAGLDDERCPDVLVLVGQAGAAAESHLADEADALLSDGPGETRLGRLPVFGQGAATGLRALAAARVALPAA
jgi:glycosyltransferase involved in cell wall biosynthesis